MSYYVVATYYEDQLYGGPEEGGWWYQTRELADVVGGAPTEEHAWYLAQCWNERHDTQPRATVVELGRKEAAPELRRELCHLDRDLDEDEYVIRWDVPEWEPEGRPHYC